MAGRQVGLAAVLAVSAPLLAAASDGEAGQMLRGGRQSGSAAGAAPAAEAGAPRGQLDEEGATTTLGAAAAAAGTALAVHGAELGASSSAFSARHCDPRVDWCWMSNKNSGKVLCLDCWWWSCGAGTKVIQYDAASWLTSHGLKQWRLLANPRLGSRGGVCNVQNKQTMLFLTASGDAASGWGQVILGDNPGVPEAEWRVSCGSAMEDLGWCTLRNVAAGWQLTIDVGSLENGKEVILSASPPKTWQEFVFEVY